MPVTQHEPRASRPLLVRALAGGLAVWMAALPSLALAATNQPQSRPSTDAKRLAAVQRLRRETGADPAKQAAAQAAAETIERKHLPSRLLGLAKAEGELRRAVADASKPGGSPKGSPEASESAQAEALARMQAHARVVGQGAAHVQKVFQASDPRAARAFATQVKLAEKIGKLAAGPLAHVASAKQVTAAVSQVATLLNKQRPPPARPLRAAPPNPHLTVVTPQVRTASREELRRMHPRLASADPLFAVGQALSSLDEANLPPPTAQDLLATPEAPLAPPIVALANQLGRDPLQIYSYVRNNIQPEPYYGSKKGALGTLLEGSGNDADQASLLVALLRSAGISARYETGQVLLSTRQAMDFTNTNDPMAAVTVFDTIGVPAIANLAADNSIDSVVWDRHVWVRAYVPYTNYRGSNAPGGTPVWIRLDPSVKPTQRTAPLYAVGLPAGPTVPFDFPGYLSGTTPGSTTSSPLTVYEGQIAAYLLANGLSCDSLDRLLPSNPIVQLDLRLLPSELGTQLLQSEGVADALDPSTDYSATYDVDGATSTVINLPAIYGQPLALRYVGSSGADVAAIQAAGSISNVSASVTVQPALKVNGAVVWQGAPIAAGTPQVLTVTVNVPGLPQAIVPHDIVAGSIYALGLALGHPTDASLAATKAAVGSTTATGDDLDELRAQALAQTYLHHIDRDERRIFGYAQTVGVKDVTEIIAGHPLTSSTFLGFPVLAGFGNWRIDVGRESNTPLAQNHDLLDIASINELAGFQGSHWESRLFDEVFNSSGVSTTNGCQLAAAAGDPLQTLLSPGDDAMLSGYSADSVSEIQGALAQGQIVYAPQSPFTSGQFQNVEVYLLFDPVAGTAVYRESALNGGEGRGPGGAGSSGSGCPFCSGSNQPTGSAVNLANGNYTFTRTDLTLPAVGVPTVFARSYDSLSGVAGTLGKNWWHTYERRLVANGDGSVTFITGEGQLIQSLQFTPTGATPPFNSPPGWYLTLTPKTGGGWTLTRKDGSSSTYAANGLLVSDQDLDGNTRSVQRNADNTVHTVTDTGHRVSLTFAYQNGYLHTVTDLSGRVVTFSQTGGDLTSAQDVISQTEKYSYSLAHQLIGRVDKDGHLWTVGYDANGRWDEETDGVGGTMAASYDNPSRTTVFTDRRGQRTTTTFNAQGNPVAITDPLGNTRTQIWDTTNNKLTEVDARGFITTYAYDALGNVNYKYSPDHGNESWTWDVKSRLLNYNSLDITTTNTYNADETLKTSQDSAGNVTQYTYNPNGTLKTILAPGNAVATQFAYNGDGTVQQVTDPTNAVTKFSYDGAGHLTQVTDPLLHTRTMLPDGRGQVQWIKDGLQNQTFFTYDAEGNRKTVKDPTGATTGFSYDGDNRLTQVQDAQGNLTKTSYDAEGHVLARTNANGNTTSYAYDEGGRLIQVTDPLGATTALGFCADLAAAACQEVDPNGNVTKRTFDQVGRVVQVTDGTGQTTTTQFDTAGRVTRTTDADARSTTSIFSQGLLQFVSTPYEQTNYVYDVRNNRRQVTFNNETTNYVFDANNRLSTETNPLNQVTTYTYNPDGTRATKLDGNNHLTKYSYDANKRLTGVTFADGSSYTLGYDSRGHRNLEQSPAEHRTMVWDPLGRLQTVDDLTLNKTLTYGYDPLGNRTSLAFDGLTQTYSYDADSRLTAVTDPDGQTAVFGYDPGGRRSSETQGNGVVTTTSYDAANRVTQLQNAVQSFGYVYDNVGNPLSKTFADHSQELYGYDTVNRLTSEVQRDGTTVNYGYSSAGSLSFVQGIPLTGSAYSTFSATSFNAFNQIGGQSETYPLSLTYAYDNNGNRTNVTQTNAATSTTATTTYTWNDDDRLAGVQFPSGATNAYGYDVNGLRVSKRDSQGNVKYLLDGSTLLATYDATSGTRLAVYTQNPQRLDEVLSAKVAGTKLYPHTDMLGSVTAITDATTKPLATWTYDVYGTRTQTSGTLSYPFGFTGREHDADTGLIYSRQRYYDPTVGSWLGPDPLGQIAGPNRYAYAASNPVLHADPYGLYVPFGGSGGGLDTVTAYAAENPVGFVILLEDLAGLTPAVALALLPFLGVRGDATATSSTTCETQQNEQPQAVWYRGLTTDDLNDLSYLGVIRSTAQRLGTQDVISAATLLAQNLPSAVETHVGGGATAGSASIFVSASLSERAASGYASPPRQSPDQAQYTGLVVRFTTPRVPVPGNASDAEGLFFWQIGGFGGEFISPPYLASPP